MTSYKTDYIAINKYTRPGSKRSKTLGIVMHYTASPGGTAAAHKSYFGRGADGRYAGAQIFVDKTEAIAITPVGEVCYHANDNQRYVGGKPYRGVSNKIGTNANLTTVGIEMCIEKDGSIAAATFDRAVDVAAELCRLYGLAESNIYRHYDVTGKNCPAPWVSKPAEFERFKKAVAAKLGGKTAVVETATAKAPSAIEVDGYWGAATTRAMQRVLGTPVDGIISDQVKSDVTSAIGGVAYGKGGSTMVKALQKKLGVTADGYIGKDTVKAMQKRYGTPVDGKISRPSTMVKALQKQLNKGAI